MGSWFPGRKACCTRPTIRGRQAREPAAGAEGSRVAPKQKGHLFGGLRSLGYQAYVLAAAGSALALVFVFAASFFRFKRATLRLRFKTLLYCLPIRLNLYFATAIQLCNRNMKIRLTRFNIYLLSGLLACAVGCETTKSPSSPSQTTGKKRDSKKFTLLRLHLQANPDGTDRTAPIAIYR